MYYGKGLLFGDGDNSLSLYYRYLICLKNN